ncbi:DUF434 domain-containing protein [Aureibacter tunicatorum]|uniref:DUF434 domain-containing protein n=1 Tax=Aureibacter tunicatorum TaxID=866807 RepID=A0AAE3XLT2_9BACT|nr:DUF434 domain-containing protein [Aureibacter tunicatorum]MDR6240276.1 hypothetical protein [Aureibacter tunicatorum]BDD05843.1 hypothetical protein AUTU_33260 [Aureibacter tunicatorum]
MPHQQKHRGANPKDYKIFTPKIFLKLRQALVDLSYLVGKGYSSKASIKLIGDRFRFSERQRQALSHSACGEVQLLDRHQKHVSSEQLKGQTLAIDGYNQLITLEAALSKAPIFIGFDGCYRDIANVHSTYRKVEETVLALEIFARELEKLEPKRVLWVFDQPVSNSGRLRKFIQELAAEKGWQWEVILEMNPDKYLVDHEEMISISSDSWVLDGAKRWHNLNASIIKDHVKTPWLIDFRKESLVSVEEQKD